MFFYLVQPSKKVNTETVETEAAERSFAMEKREIDNKATKLYNDKCLFLKDQPIPAMNQKLLDKKRRQELRSQTTGPKWYII